jgi:hypothetical protein
VLATASANNGACDGKGTHLPRKGFGINKALNQKDEGRKGVDEPLGPALANIWGHPTPDRRAKR